MSITRDGDRETADATEKAAQARGSFLKSGGDFFAWWGDELAGLAPASLRKAFSGGAETAVIYEVDGQAVLKRRAGAPGKVIPANGKAPGGLPKGGVVYLLPDGGALRREKRLPGASRAHIHEIMNLQMASETPFSVDEVYTDSVITGEVDATREIVVIQALAPRPAIDDIVLRMRQDYGIELAGVDLADPSVPGGRAGFNILPVSQRPRTSGGGFAGMRLLALLLVGAGVFAGLSWRDLQERRIAAADTLLADAEGGAAGAMQVSTRVSQGVEAIRRLASEQADPTAFLRVYDEVAGLLPPGTWLEEFSYERPTAFLTGLSANSATLVEAFEASDLVQGARFASPIVTDPLSGAQRFRLEVTFKAAAAVAPAPAPAAPAEQQPAEEPQE